MSTGHDAHALDVLYSIAILNGGSPPNLTLEDFQALEYVEWKRDLQEAERQLEIEAEDSKPGSPRRPSLLGKYLGHLGGMFRSRTYAYLFIILAIA